MRTLKDYGYESELYDYQIVQVAQQACNQLGIKMQVRRVWWFDIESRIGKVDSDECSLNRDYILLPKRMRGVLEPEEWRPIITSSAIWRKFLRHSQPGRETAGLFLGIILLLFGLGFLLASFGSVLGGILSLTYVVTLVVPLMMNLTTQAHKKLRLASDTRAATLVGADVFLSLLHKIDGLGMKDINTTNERRVLRHFSSKPSIAERIRNISYLIPA